MLIALRKCAVKNEEDAEMAHAVAAHLVRALADYKDYTGGHIFYRYSTYEILLCTRKILFSGCRADFFYN